MNNKYPKEFIFKHLAITKLSNEKAIEKYLKEIENLKKEMEHPLEQQETMRSFKKQYKKQNNLDVVAYYADMENTYKERVNSIKDEIQELEKIIEEYEIENKFIERTLSEFEVEDEIKKATELYNNFKVS